jgi:hypothetical protein
MAQRSLHVVTKAYYRSMSCFATDFPAKDPSCTMWSRQITKYVTKYDTKNDANPHSTEKDTQPIAFLISKQASPYRTRVGTCCPRVSTPKIQSVVDLSHDGINHLHHSNHCSNHGINPHTAKPHLEDGKPQHSHIDTSQTQHYKGWKDMYDTHDCMAKHNKPSMKPKS